jgi:pimeloyl-ACP methyl ester carboxylesterase
MPDNSTCVAQSRGYRLIGGLLARIVNAMACATVWSLASSAFAVPDLPGAQSVVLGSTIFSVAQSGTGAPTVVFENGLAAKKEVWTAVAASVAKTHAVFVYDRPGQGASSSSNSPRSGAQIVEDLRGLLKSRKLEPPYVLVGHSLGGLYIQLYARKYPQEVAGLVLVDSTHPLHFSGEGAPERRSFLSRALLAAGLWGNANEEFKNIADTGREVLALPALKEGIPAVILIAPQKVTASDPADIAIGRRDNDLRRDFATMYPTATLRAVHTGHIIQSEDPDLVIHAIEEVLEIPPK